MFSRSMDELVPTNIFKKPCLQVEIKETQHRTIFPGPKSIIKLKAKRKNGHDSAGKKIVFEQPKKTALM